MSSHQPPLLSMVHGTDRHRMQEELQEDCVEVKEVLPGTGDRAWAVRLCREAGVT